MENDEQKPLHVVNKDGSKDDPVYNLFLHDQGLKQANEKANELALHFPEGTQFFVTAEQDDDKISYYLNFKFDF